MECIWRERRRERNMRANGKLLLVALLPLLLGAQVLTDAENEFFEEMDNALGLHPGSVVADIGTGLAVLHPIRIAEKVGPGGRVVCVDVRHSVVAAIKAQAETHHLKNLEAVLGKEDDPLLPAAIFDAILVSNTYHEFSRPSAMLKHLGESLKPEGRLVIVENYSDARKNENREDQAKRHDMSPDILEKELSAAGFVIIKRPNPVLIVPERFRYLLVGANRR